MTISYSQRFQEPEAVAAYEADEYAADSYSTRIWQLQRPVVEKIIRDHKSKTSDSLALLDFACGTGRVLSWVENFAVTAHGIDISEQMVSVAQKKCRRAQLFVGDVFQTPELLARKYDVITCFRLLLNLEPELRGRILLKLQSALAETDGLLIVNVHGNSRSLRHPAIVWRRWRKRGTDSNVMANEMSVRETEKLLSENGFRVVRKIGFGILPPGLYKTPLRHLAFAVDRFCAGKSFFNRGSVDILFVCTLK